MQKRRTRSSRFSLKDISLAAVVFIAVSGISYEGALTQYSEAATATTLPTCTVNATKTSIAPGDSVVISWTSKNATSGSISGIASVALSGSQTVTPSQTTKYTGSFVNGTKKAACGVQVTVTPPTPACTLTANKTSITAGQTATLSWSSTNAQSGSISGVGSVALNGSAGVSPTKTTKYTATFVNGSQKGTCSNTITVVQPPPITTLSNVSYGSDKSEKLDVCIPAGLTGSAPAIIFIHGGSFVAGDKSEFSSYCKQAAQEGLVGVEINYRLVGTAKIATELNDAQLAVRWLRTNAATYHVNPQKICSWGDSAGAYFSTALGVWANAWPGDQSSKYPGVSSQVQCVVENSGPIDFVYPDTPPSQLQMNHDLSPIYFITATTSPMRITHGNQDTTVNPLNGQKLSAALQAAGVPYEYVTYNGGHVYAGLSTTDRNKIIQDSFNFVISKIATP